MRIAPFQKTAFLVLNSIAAHSYTSPKPYIEGKEGSRFGSPTSFCLLTVMRKLKRDFNEKACVGRALNKYCSMIYVAAK